MACNEEHDVFKEREKQHNAAVNDLLQEFFRKKDEFEASLEGITLSDAERKRLLKAMEFTDVAKRADSACSKIGDFENSERVIGFCANIYCLIQTGSYVQDIPQEPMIDDYNELGFGD